MQISSKKAFTMIELVFVIVVIGILAAIAVPKFAATRDDAVITKAITTVAAVRSALATERQKRILRGDFDPLTTMDTGTTNGTDDTIFDYYDGNTTGRMVLEYPIRSCKDGNARGCWIKTGANTYDYRMPYGSNDITFTVDLNKFRFTCSDSDADCKMLTK